MTAVEKSDTDLDATVKDISHQVKSKNIVLYPYAHLSSDLASPEVAIEVLDRAEKELSRIKGFSVTKAPFGYYKEFELKVKGHPLSELSREIKIEGGKTKASKKSIEKTSDETEALKAEKKLHSYWYIMTPDRKLHDIGKFDYSKGRLVKSLIEEYVTKRVKEYGGMEVETPLIYDINHPTLSKYLQRFPARQHQIESDK